MTSAIRGGLLAAVSVFALTLALPPAVQAQQTAALAANPELANPELAAKGAWSSTTTYARDDLVTSRGSTWRSRRNSNLNKVPGQTSPSTENWWELFARGFNPTGEWTSSRTYHPDDLVTRQGQTWRARQTIAAGGAAPTAGANWQLFAARGAPGPNTGIGTGSQSMPSISFNGDANTGIYSPEAGKIALVADGALFLHNKGDENVGVGVNALSITFTGIGNTAVGASALRDNTGSNNTAVGRGALRANDDGHRNTAVGMNALASHRYGDDNTAVGVNALFSNGNAILNTALGSRALYSNTGGENNVAVGAGALASNISGSVNVAVGTGAGGSATNSGNSIFISNGGLAGDTATIKIGTQGTQTTAFMAGIAGVNAGDVPVYVDSTTGQLGIGPAPSSRRFKYGIETMADMSALLTKLRPVTFRYHHPRGDGSHPLQYGLIAEEVAELIPDLALFDNEGRPDGVKYHLLPSFLLAGYQAQQKTIAAQAGEIAELKERLAAIEAMLPRTTRAAAR